MATQPSQLPAIQLAVFISGSGTTLLNMVDCIKASTLNARVNIVIASRAGIKGIDRAKELGLRCEVVERSKYFSYEEFSNRVFSLCDEVKVDLYCMAGWLSLLDIPARLDGRVMNIHPALLPSFGGKGMYGLRVHEGVINHGCKVSGCTVHFVDRSYDNGPIILQRTCPVLERDTPEDLAHRVFEEEKIAYPQAISLFQQGRLKIEGRRVRILDWEDFLATDEKADAHR